MPHPVTFADFWALGHRLETCAPTAWTAEDVATLTAALAALWVYKRQIMDLEALQAEVRTMHAEFEVLHATITGLQETITGLQETIHALMM